MSPSVAAEHPSSCVPSRSHLFLRRIPSELIYYSRIFHFFHTVRFLLHAVRHEIRLTIRPSVCLSGRPNCHRDISSTAIQFTRGCYLLLLMAPIGWMAAGSAISQQQWFNYYSKITYPPKQSSIHPSIAWWVGDADTQYDQSASALCPLAAAATAGTVNVALIEGTTT